MGEAPKWREGGVSKEVSEDGGTFKGVKGVGEVDGEGDGIWRT